MQNTYSTSDMVLCITLSALNFPLDSVDRSDPQRVCFFFERREGLDETVRAFYQHQIKLVPQLYAAHQKLIKNALYAPRTFS